MLYNSSQTDIQNHLPEVFMYRIVICDDEIFFCNHIEKLLRKYTESLADDMDIQIYTSSDAFLEDIGKSADLYFLDIKMPGNSGLELANVIRSISPDSVIIFVSSLQDAVYESIQYSPFRFIRKEYLETELKEAMDAFFAIRKPAASVLELHTSTGDIFIPAITIHYVETASHYLNFYTTRQTYTVRGKISDFAPVLLPCSILQVNQSFLVNLNYVASYHNHKITLENHNVITISRPYRNLFKEEFLQYQRSHYHVTTL